MLCDKLVRVTLSEEYVGIEGQTVIVIPETIYLNPPFSVKVIDAVAVLYDDCIVKPLAGADKWNVYFPPEYSAYVKVIYTVFELYVTDIAAKASATEVEGLMSLHIVLMLES